MVLLQPRNLSMVSKLVRRSVLQLFQMMMVVSRNWNSHHFLRLKTKKAAVFANCKDSGNRLLL